MHIYSKKKRSKEGAVFALYLFKYVFTAPVFIGKTFTVNVYLFIYRERQLSLGVAQQENRFIMLYCGMTPERPIWFHDLKRKWAGTELSI